MNKILSPEELHEYLDYNPDTGILTWKDRTGNPSWNARYAGRPAINAINSRSGYRTGTLLGHPAKAHRVAYAMYHGEWPTDQLDHWDWDTTNNRISNLRPADGFTNSRNRKARKRHSHPDLPAGVYRQPRANGPEVYQSSIRVRGKFINVGTFTTADEAHSAYLAALKAHGFSPHHGRDLRDRIVGKDAE